MQALGHRRNCATIPGCSCMRGTEGPILANLKTGVLHQPMSQIDGEERLVMKVTPICRKSKSKSAR